MHGVMHLGWVPDGTGGYRGQMAVLVKPNGLLGTGYMAAIRPFRHLIVYPPMLREIGRGWGGRAPPIRHRLPDPAAGSPTSGQRRCAAAWPWARRGSRLVLPPTARRPVMSLGTSIFLIAVGAIMRFAIHVSTTGFSIHTAGTILMVVGAIGLLLSLFWMLVWSDRRRGVVVRDREVVREPRVRERDVY